MSKFIVEKILKELNERGIPITKSRILILGLTFKEDCPDIRNTKVIDIINLLKDKNFLIDIFDPNVENPM